MPGITIDEFIESLMFMKSRAHPLDIVGHLTAPSVAQAKKGLCSEPAMIGGPGNAPMTSS